MKFILLFLVLVITSCGSKENEQENLPFQEIEITKVLDDSISIRAIEVVGEDLAFAGTNGKYGLYNSSTDSWKTNVQTYDSLVPEFRAIASTAEDFFLLSVGNPALLFKTGDHGKMELVYKEENDKVFYDALEFWNDKEGIAMGDPTENCLSILITRDGGKSWEKVSCEDLPEAAEGEAAFAASNSNIAIQGDNTWILSGGMRSRIFHSPDKGKTWKVYDTPLNQGTPTTGGYTMDFYDEKRGVIAGGDYTTPEGNQDNFAITEDGGKTWTIISNGVNPGYTSGIRYVPNRDANEFVAVGPKGISYSPDKGKTWKTLNDEEFYTLRFVNDSTAYVAGKNNISKVLFKK